MRQTVYYLLIAALSGCAAARTVSIGSALVPREGRDFDEVFTAAVRAAWDARLVPKNADRELGLIHAVPDPGSPSGESGPELFIQVGQNEAGYTVELQSSRKGRSAARDAARIALEVYCNALGRRLPGAVITIDGSPWTPSP